MRIRWTIGVILAVILSTGTVAQAEVYQDVIRGFELFGWRFSGQQNLLGKGWDVSAVADYSAGANFNLGIADVTFSGTAIGATAGYTLRGIPSAHFRMGTNNTPLAYTYAFNTGLQDMTIEGGILINIDTEINLLGFYDNTIRISNRGTFDTDGFAFEEAGTLDYDVGPISLSGNIYLDAIVALTQPFFDASGSENPLAKLSARATRVASLTETVEELQARVAAGEILSDEEIAMLVNNSMLLAMLAPDTPLDQLDGALLASYVPETKSVSPEINVYLQNSKVPEPTTLILLALAMAGLRLRRR